MAKSKKKRKSHKGPPKPFRRRWAEIEELLGSEHMKEVREIFCEADCPFFGECKGYELTKFCQLKAWGRYDRLFERSIRHNVCKEKKIEFRTADDILLRRWDDEDADALRTDLGAILLCISWPRPCSEPLKPSSGKRDLCSSWRKTPMASGGLHW